MSAAETMETPVVPRSRALVPRSRAHLMSRTSYTGAGSANSNIALWRPPLRSADADIMRDAGKVRARARDLERNHPYAQQAVRASRIGVIGKKLRFSCRPDHRFLGIDQEVAMRWGQEFERVFDNYAHGLGQHSDAGRRMSFTEQMALAHDRDFTDGESLTVAEWAPNRRWKTCFQSIDVDRLSNPHGVPDTPRLKGGVLLDDLGAPLGYYIQNAHPADSTFMNSGALSWSFVTRETPWGRFIAAHTFENLRPGQTRGMSAFASVIAAMKMGQEYTETTLQQSILQASYAAVIVSQQNYKDALEAIAGMPPDQAMSITDLAEQNLEAAMAHHEAVQLRFNGSAIPVMWPGEELKIVQPGNGAAAIGEFQRESTKSYAAGTGTDPISVSQDYSNVNYSSAKMAAATSWRTYEIRRERLINGVAMPMVAAFLEELVHAGQFDLPKGLSRADFYDALPALVKGTFLTQGAPMLDPVKERQSQMLGVTLGVETTQDIAASEGKDYLDVFDQIARENMERADRKLPPAGVPPGIAAAAEDKADGKDKPAKSEE